MNRKEKRDYAHKMRFKSQNSEQEYMIALFKEYRKLLPTEKKQMINWYISKINSIKNRSETYFTLANYFHFEKELFKENAPAHRELREEDLQ